MYLLEINLLYSISFMYDLPPGHPKNKATEEAAANSAYDKNGQKKKDCNSRNIS